jgi:hypothetical protein
VQVGIVGGQCCCTVKLTYLCNVQENCKNVNWLRPHCVQLKAQQVYCVCQTGTVCSDAVLLEAHTMEEQHSVICVLVSEDSTPAHVAAQ